MHARYDILGIGNAIVDVVAQVDEAFLTRHGMAKGSMALIDAAGAEAIYAAMPPGEESSGGSVANSCAVAAGLGARVAYLGKVADDQLGGIFRHDITAAGVTFPSTPLTGGAPTARCLIAVTPDGQRTMNTFLGACVHFGEADVDAELIAEASVLYLEGYLFDPPEAQAAFYRAADLAHRAGRKVALSLSDAFCVGRHRDAFRKFVREHVDILFANESEILSLYETADFAAAAALSQAEVELAALTRSAEGSLVLRGAERVAVAPVAAKLVDTTGAGDAYAAGFLYGLTQGHSLAECGRTGSIAASAVISQIGARPRSDLRALIAG
jgi:fructokinase